MPKRGRALKILFDTFWSPRGWVANSPSDEDFEVAKAAGLMFDAHVATHDEIVKRANVERGQADPSAIAAAFVGSLSRRLLAQRSALGSFFAMQHLSPHAFVGDARECSLCGTYEKEMEDINGCSFERQKWGGVSHDSVEYAGFDLWRFRLEKFEQPNGDDRELMKAILERARSARVSDRPSHLAKSLADAMPGTAAERKHLIQLLGYAGVLVPHHLPSYRERFVGPQDRALKNEWAYPVAHWRGADGVDEGVVRKIFGPEYAR